MLLLSQPLYWLFMLVIIMVSILIGYIIWFTIRYVRLRHNVNEYMDFINEYYIQKGTNPPAFILRIKRECVKEYNELAGNWMGILIHIKPYPQENELPDTKVNYFDN